MKKSLLQITMIIPLALLLCFAISCQQQVEEGITEEEAKALWESSLEIWNEGNLAVVDELYDPNIIRHDCGLPEDIVGLDAFKNYVTLLRVSYPDFNVTLDELIVKGDKIVIRWTLTGTNTGPLQTHMGELPPTDQKMRVSGVEIVRLVNGKKAEQWIFYNQLDGYLQLGFTLTPPQPPGTLSPVRAIGSIKPPKLIKEIKPVYPEKAKEAKVEGEVILEATTDIYGRVQNVKVLKSIPLLDQAAVDAVRKWVYEPMIIDGKPRGVIFTVTLTFHLK